MKKNFVVHIETENWQAWSQDLSLIYNWTCSNLKEGLSANEYTHFFKSPKLLQILCLAWISDLFKWIWWMMFTSFLLIYLTSSRLVAQKAVTRDFQWLWSLAIFCISPEVFPVFFKSVVRVLLQVSFGLPLQHIPSEVHFIATFEILLGSLLTVCQNHLNLLCFILVMIFLWPVFSYSLASKFCRSFLSICCGILRAPGNLSVLSTFWSI